MRADQNTAVNRFNALRVFGLSPVTAYAQGAENPEPIGAECRLCGLPVGRHCIREKSGEETLHFCCFGCRQVFQILSGFPQGLPEDFKNTDLFLISQASGLIGKNGQASNDEHEKNSQEDSVRAKELEAEDLVQELILRLEGLWCSACAWLIEGVLIRLPGVQEVKVLFAADLVRIKYLPHQTTVDRIQEDLSRLGYRSLPIQDPGRTGEARKRVQLRLGVSSLLAAHVMMLSLVIYGGFFQDLGAEAIRIFSYSLLILSTPVILYGGFPIFKKALASLRHGHPSMEVLISISVLSAYLYSLFQMGQVSLHLYFDTSCMLIILVLLGKYLEARARERIAGGLTELYLLAHQKVRLFTENGERWQPADEIQPGEEIQVLSGERVPIDGQVVFGQADVDESSLTGESRPIRKGPNDEIRAGSQVLDGELGIRVTRVGSESSIGRILTLIQEGLSGKTAVEAWADRLSRWVIPGLMLLASGTAGYLVFKGQLVEEALLRALTILVIACPCALGLAAPLAKVASIGIGRTRGILIRDPSALEKIQNLDVLVFDKTGTLTEGRYLLRTMISFEIPEKEALQRVASLEALSDHYLAREIQNQARAMDLPLNKIEDFRFLDGLGLRGRVEGIDVIIGNRELMRSQGYKISENLESQIRDLEKQGETVVIFGWSKRVQGFMGFGDALKPKVGPTLGELKLKGLKIRLVSGDATGTTRAIADQLGISSVIGQAHPQTKVEVIKELQQKGHRVGMVGDGLNDAAALAQADVGFALGLRGGIVTEVSDITLLTDDPEKVLEVLVLADRTSSVIRQNLSFAFFYNALGIPLAMMGLINPLLAALAMFASSLTVVGNTLRLYRKEEGTRMSNRFLIRK
jgi:heavy metal translocating P-type ATPase